MLYIQRLRWRSTLRNAAKARTRDKSGKVQKEFFGRRRLNLLSKGLGVQPRLLPWEITGVKTSGTSIACMSIDLNHVKRTKSLQVDHAYNPESPKSTPSISRKRKIDNILAFTTSTSSPHSKGSLISSSSFNRARSKLLQQLDTLEREFVMLWAHDFGILHHSWRIKAFSSNAAISRILAMRDLAGLSGLSPGEQSRSESLSLSPIAIENNEVEGGEEIMDYLSEVCSSCDLTRLVADNLTVWTWLRSYLCPWSFFIK